MKQRVDNGDRGKKHERGRDEMVEPPFGPLSERGDVLSRALEAANKPGHADSPPAFQWPSAHTEMSWPSHRSAGGHRDFGGAAAGQTPVPRVASDCKILVIDDDNDTRESFKMVLEEHGYGAACASDGKKALEYLRSGQPLPDLILLDLMMPVMNGWEFRDAQTRDPGLRSIPVVVISASGAARERVGLMGVCDFVLKPVHLQQLLRTVAEALELD